MEQQKILFKTKNKQLLKPAFTQKREQKYEKSTITILTKKYLPIQHFFGILEKLKSLKDIVFLLKRK